MEGEIRNKAMITKAEQAYNDLLLLCDRKITREDTRIAVQKALCVHWMRLQHPSKWYDDKHKQYVRQIMSSKWENKLGVMENRLTEAYKAEYGG